MKSLGSRRPELLSTFKGRLVALVSLLVFALFAAILASGFIWFRENYTRSIDNNIEVASAIGSILEAFVRDVARQEHAIGRAIEEFPFGSPARINEYLLANDNEYVALKGFVIADSNGLIRYSSHPGLIGDSISDRTYFHQVRAGDTIVVSDFLLTRVANEPGFVIARGFYMPDGRLRFCVAGAIEAGLLGSLTLDLRRLRNASFSIFDSKGNVIYTNTGTISEDQRNQIHEDPLLRRALRGETASGFLTIPYAPEPQRIGARVPILDLGWVVGASISQREFFLPLFAPLLLLLLFSGLIAGGVLALGLRSINTVARRLNDVQIHMERVSQGEFGIVESKSGLVEIDQLTDYANNMAQNLQERDTKLKRFLYDREVQSQFLQTVLQAIPTGIAVVREDGYRYEYCNSAYSRIAGVPVEGIVGKTVPEIFPDYVKNNGLEVFDTIFETGNTIHVPDLETYVGFENKRRLSHFDVTFLPLPPDENNRRGVLVSAQETTEQVVALRKIQETALRDEAILGNINDGLMLLDPNGDISYLNPTGLGILGFSSMDQVLKPLNDFQDDWEIFDSSGELIAVDQWPASRALTMDFQNLVYRMRRSHEEYDKYLSFSARTVRDPHGAIIAVVLSFHDITEIKRSEEALRESEAHLRELKDNLESLVLQRTDQVRTLSKALTLAEQRERRRFSQILHEVLQQVLFAAKMHLDLVKEDYAQGTSEAGEDIGIENSITLITKALEITRTMAVELNPPILNTQGLDSALRWLVSFYQDNYGLSIDASIVTQMAAVRGEAQIMLLQMVRELLNNVDKHSGVRDAQLQTWCHDGKIRITVSDQGKGFEIEKARVLVDGSETKLGLFSIEERLKLFGGKLFVESRGGKGTSVTIELPYGRC